ncbi:MAG: HigA family addiction module antitoxin [Gemmobacter sp.]
MDIRFARPIHPGEMLREEFMVPLRLTSGRLARAIGVPRTRIERLVREETALTTETAALLARYFGMSEGYWVGLQREYELDLLHADAAKVARLDKVVPLARPDLGEVA